MVIWCGAFRVADTRQLWLSGDINLCVLLPVHDLPPLPGPPGAFLLVEICIWDAQEYPVYPGVSEIPRDVLGQSLHERVQAASEKVTRLANETITMLREKREKVIKEDGSIAARNIIARLGKGELRTDAALREQVLDVLVVHRHLIPTARRGHYMMMVPHD